MTKPTRIQRRQFVTSVTQASLVFAIPTIVPATALGLDGATPPSERIQLGVIGMGRRCKCVMAEVLKLNDVRCRVIADVQATRRDEGKKIVDTAYGDLDCVTLRDFREVLARKDIDAVLIATGDRWHATASMMAAEAGNHDPD